jgi:hypothetical protein
MKTAVEMTGHGRRGKPKAGFPPRPQPLEIANCAIPTFPPLRRSNGKVENQKQVSHFPTAYDLPWMTKFRKEGLAAELRSFSRLTVRLEYAPHRFAVAKIWWQNWWQWP